MMTLRRALMNLVEDLPLEQWNYTVIKTTSEISLGGGLFNILNTNIPSVTTAIGVVDLNYNNIQTYPDGTAFSFVYNGNANQSVFFRILSGSLDITSSRAMTDTYACKIPAGTDIGVLYI